MASILKANEVFGIAELLEKILLELDPREILIAQQTNKTSRDTINDSIVLKRRLGISPDPTGHVSSPFSAFPARFPGLSCDVGYRDWYPDNDRTGPDTTYTISITLNSPVPRVGSRYRSMLLCQPFVENSSLFLKVVGYGFQTERSTIKVNALGPTVGNLLDAITSHWAFRSEKKRKGAADFVTFTQTVELKEDDPIMIARKKEWKGKCARKAESQAIACSYGWTQSIIGPCGDGYDDSQSEGVMVPWQERRERGLVWQERCNEELRDPGYFELEKALNMEATAMLADLGEKRRKEIAAYMTGPEEEGDPDVRKVLRERFADRLAIARVKGYEVDIRQCVKDTRVARARRYGWNGTVTSCSEVD